jgi:vacuolar iron transporter family protein
MADATQPSEAANQEGRQLIAQREQIAKLQRVRQLVFGSLDGLLVPLGVVSGVAAGTGSSRAVIVAGLAEAFAGAVSMGAGEFISGRSEAQVQLAQVRKELDEMRAAPQSELAEMIQLFQEEGVEMSDATAIAETLSRYPTAYAKTMVEKELGVPFEPRTAKLPEAVTMAVSYVVAAIVPLISYFFFPVHVAFGASLGLTFAALVVVGLIKGRLTRMRLLRSVAEVVIVGAVSGIGGYLLGSVLPRLFGY